MAETAESVPTGRYPAIDTSEEERLAWDRFMATALAIVVPNSPSVYHKETREEAKERILVLTSYAAIVADRAMAERRRRFGECR
jgi:hypothetical protein